MGLEISDGVEPNISTDIQEECIEEEEEDEDSSDASSYLYIQMEYCKNQTLRQAIDSSDLLLNRHRMWKLFCQIVDGIAYLHSMEIIHRDLKVRKIFCYNLEEYFLILLFYLQPENIFLDSSDRIKIGDFGLATNAGNERLKKGYGTGLYMAPEMKDANGRVVKYCTNILRYAII